MSAAPAKAQKQTIEPFVTSRSFKVPRERLWKAFTELDQMKQWFGPRGFTTKQATLDFRPGGAYHYCLVAPNGQEMWGKMTYREISPPSRMVMASSFSDPQGGVTRHPMSPTWPRQMLTTVTLTDEGGGRSRFTVEWLPVDPNEEELRAFEEGRDGMKQGWAGTFDRLEQFLDQK